MQLHGIIRAADLAESPSEDEAVEMILRIQGVGADQPRTIVVPFPLLLQNPTLEPATVVGRGFEADVEPDEGQRWVVARITLAAPMLRSKE
jgi:hypothetical protein